MLLNISSRQHSVVINGIDFSEYLIYYEAGDASVNDSGIISTQGSLKLQATANIATTLDSRLNTNFAKKNRVVATVDGTIIPRGILRIRGRHYNLKQRILTLQLCDLLTLLEQDQDESSASNCLGTPTPVTTVINLLLAKAGAPPLIDSIPGVVYFPPQSGNLIQTCGKIAWEMGYALYVDKNESVRAVRVDLWSSKPSTFTKKLDEIKDYDRMSSGDIPPASIKISANLMQISKKKLNQETILVSDGMTGKSLTVEKFDGKKRTIETFTKELANNIMPWYFEFPFFMPSGYKLEEWEYQEKKIGTPPINALMPGQDDDCKDGIEKILKKKTVTVFQPYGVALKEWILQHELDKEDKMITYVSPTFGKAKIYIDYTQLIPAYEEIEVYEYASDNHGIKPLNSSPPSVGDGIQVQALEKQQEEQIVTQRISVIKRKLRGAIFAESEKITSQRPMARGDYLVVAETNDQVWRKDGSDYIKQELSRVSWASHDSAAADELWKKIEEERREIYSSGDIFADLVTQENRITISNSGTTQPPAPETAPPLYQISQSQKDVEIVVRSPFLASSFSPPPKTYRLEFPIQGGEIAWRSQAEMVGRNLMSLDWGRYEGVEISDSPDDWSDYKPLIPFTLNEEGIKYRYVADAFAIVLTKTECVCSLDGLWCGGGGVLGEITTGTQSVQVMQSATASLGQITAISVARLTGWLERGTILTIGGATVRVTADAPPGAEEISVQPIGNSAVAIAPGVATYPVEIFQPPFDAIVPIESTIAIEPIAFDRDVMVFEAEIAIADIVFDTDDKVVEEAIADIEFDLFADDPLPTEEAIAEIAIEAIALTDERVLPRSRVEFSFSSPTTIWIRESRLVEQIRIIVVTAFSASVTISVGDDNNPGRFISGYAPIEVGIMDHHPGHLYAIPTWVKLTITGNATSGLGYLYLQEG
ncbi:MAG TPA: hypothetical protein DCY88_07760 [Cyanobacteria bacterium UBA11372]|nr:hypothetical protein [Cyanobacteria bacterium UBA11372]